MSRLLFLFTCYLAITPASVGAEDYVSFRSFESKEIIKSRVEHDFAITIEDFDSKKFDIERHLPESFAFGFAEKLYFVHFDLPYTATYDGKVIDCPTRINKNDLGQCLYPQGEFIILPTVPGQIPNQTPKKMPEVAKPPNNLGTELET